MELIRIEGKTSRGMPFVVGVELHNGVVVRVPPLVKYMRGWSDTKVRSYAAQKGWSAS